MSLSTTQYGYIVDPMVPFTDDKGKTIKNGFIRVFMAGTSTPVITYRNYDGATNQEKIELDNSGRVKHNVIGSKGSLYKVVVYDAHHSQETPILTVDKIAVLGASINASGATIVTGLDSVTVPEENFLKATVEGTGVELALDPTEVTSDVNTISAAETAAPDYVLPLLDKTGTGDGKKISLANLFKFALDWISRLATTVTSFASGDFIAVSNTTNGARKMSKDTLLELTAQNALAGNVAPDFVPNSTTTVAGLPYVYNGSLYIAREAYQGPWDANKFYAISVSDLFSVLKNNGSTVFDFLYSESVNIFVKSNPVHGYYDQYGTFTQNASYRVTEPILLRPNTTYKLPFSSSLGGNEYVFILNADGSFNRTIRGSVSAGFLTFTSPLNEWVLASFNMGPNYDESNFMVCEASQYPNSFVKGSGYQLRFENAPEELKTIVSVSPNLFDKSVTQGFLENTTIDSGSYGTTSGYYVSYPIRVKGGVTYKSTRKAASLGGNFRYAVLDDEYNLVSTPSGSNDNGNNDYLVFTPSSDCFIRLNMASAPSLDAAKATFMLAEYDEYPAEYVPAGRSIYSDIGLGKRQKDEVEELVDTKVDNVAFVSPNLFDGSVTTGYLANTTIDSGSYGTTPNYYASQPILVKGGVKYKATHKASFGGNYRYAVLDDEYNLVSTPSGTNDGGDTNYIVFTPASDCYIRLSVGTGTSWAVANAGFILSEYDKFPAEYISYGRKIADDIGLGKKQEQEVVDIADKHIFKGKVLAVNGDSICKGENAGGGYGQIIAEMFGMVLQNRGTNGATITAGTTDGGGNNRRWICRDVQYMADNADYVLIEGGVNDASLGVTMGDISEGYAATLDDETFAGAFETVVRDLLTKYPGKKVGYIAVHKMTNGYRSNGPDTNYYWTAKKICEKWGMPLLDLNVSVPAFGFFSTDTPIGALRTNYTKSGDGWHPTEDGYKKYYVDKIVQFMRRL